MLGTCASTSFGGENWDLQKPGSQTLDTELAALNSKVYSNAEKKNIFLCVFCS